MSRFIAAMDNSGGSAGGVLEKYGQEYTEANKMDLIHAMRLRMINSPAFNSMNIWVAILYKDSVDRGLVQVLEKKQIRAYLKIDNGIEENGCLKYIDIQGMIDFAKENGCTGTKMRSVIKDAGDTDMILAQQFSLAEDIYRAGLMPIVEPEIPIEHANKQTCENILRDKLAQRLDKFKGKCILKLTLPDIANFYSNIMAHKNVHKIVGLSGGYTTDEACVRLSQQPGMTASFSRGLSEGLYLQLTDAEFHAKISSNIDKIKSASKHGVGE